MTSPQTIGRYEVLEEIGQGAMGTVYRAKDPSMGRIVALKTIRTEVLAGNSGGELRERFYREARAAGALAHPGIVPVFDVGEDGGTPFLVMEFIDGRTLADRARAGERFSIERVCEIGQQIAEALGYAHKNGVVHRDVKAANILLTSRESYGIERPKIADFGVAKLTTAQITTTGQMLGTPAYMPPEQFTGGPIDGRADLFALGVILYWMTTGELPFPGETLMTVSYKIVNTDPIAPRKLNPAMPEALSQAILKCLAKNPADRYQTGEELARDLAGLREAGMSTAARQRAAAATAVDMSADPGATIDQLPTAKPTPTVPPQQEPPIMPLAMATAAGTKKENVVLVAVVAALVIAVAGLYVLQGRNRNSGAAPAAPAAAVPAAPSVPPASTPAAATPVAAAPKAPAAPQLAGAEPVAGAPDAALNEGGAVNFDPRTLSPNENARLRVDAGRLAPTAEIVLLMDGKIFMRRTVAEFKEHDDDMYLPPGVHEFRARARNGPLMKVSNIASTDFPVKKRQTLRLELRLPPAQRGQTLTPQEFGAAARLFISFR